MLDDRGGGELAGGLEVGGEPEGVDGGDEGRGGGLIGGADSTGGVGEVSGGGDEAGGGNVIFVGGGD